MKLTPIGISNRHLHLAQHDAEILFGEGYTLKKLKDLSQPGQFACEEVVTIKGSKGQIDGVRILGPYRKDTQVEIMLGDNFKLGIQAPIRLSGDLEGTSGIDIIGPKGSITINKGVIVAKRHIHMNPQEAETYGVHDGQIVAVKTSGQRSVIFNEVVIRVTPQSALDMHIDIEEGNAAGIKNGEQAEIV